MKKKEDRMVILELSEHDASKLLALIKREMNQADTIWRSYWERQARNVQQSIERNSVRYGRTAHQGEGPNG